MRKIITKTILLLQVFILPALPGFAQLPDRLYQGLILDLNADTGVSCSDSNRVESWLNTAPRATMHTFSKRDEGRKIPGSGQPQLKRETRMLHGHKALVFLKQELLNMDEDGCDKLITGNGFTWICVLRPYQQVGLLPDVNSFFGSLKNGGNYEGFWAGFTDDNRLWTGARNGISFGRWDANNPRVLAPQPLDTNRFYLLAGRMAAGTGTVKIEVFINDLSGPVASDTFPVNPKANSSMLAIGQERDAIQHPGVESFNGEIARFLLYERPLNNKEMKRLQKTLVKYYSIMLH